MKWKRDEEPMWLKVEVALGVMARHLGRLRRHGAGRAALRADGCVRVFSVYGMLPHAIIHIADTLSFCCA